MSIKCHKCGEPLEPGMKKCPKCGSGDKDVMLGESNKILGMVSAKVKGEGFHKFKLHVRQGEKVGKDGKIVRETRRIDKETRQYYHRVQKQNEKGEWVTVHEEGEPLEQHRRKDQDRNLKSAQQLNLEEGKDMSRLRTLILAIVIIIVVVGVVIASLSMQSPRVHTITIFSDQETVFAGTYNPHLFTIPSEVSNRSVSGTFTAQGGSDNDIQIYIIDSANFGNYSNNNDFSYLYYSGQIHTASFSVNLSSGNYYLVLDNKFSISSQKLVSIQMNATYTK